MKTIFQIILIFITINCFSQGNPPWERPLKIAWSGDGTTFSNTTIFQDSSGVPSAVKWKSDTLVCVFQWFRQPQGSLTWDRVAVKFSYDAGLNWTQPVPIVINGIPGTYQRPFDPTLAVLNTDSIRIYFSSSNGMPTGGLDSTINTYSAISTDGINYSFEPGPRFDHPTNRVIDPAIIHFDGNWHYSAPIAAPQDGAYHCISMDGLNFIQQNDYLSNSSHNWTGNFMINNNSELRFYGSGPQIWYNASMDGFIWQGFNNTNINGGDPSVVQTDSVSYMIIFVGEPYLSSIPEQKDKDNDKINIRPNPVSEYIYVSGSYEDELYYSIYSISGSLELTGKIKENENISITCLNKGVHFLMIKRKSTFEYFKIIK